MSGLEQFRGHIWLDGKEKNYRMGKLADALVAGDVDYQMVSVLEKFNAIPWLCTTQCCCGHGEKLPHLDLRVALAFDDMWKKVSGWLDAHSANLSVEGSEMDMPRFCFWLPQMPEGEAVAAFDELADVLS